MAKQYTFKELDKMLRQNGYRMVRSKGSHRIYKNDEGNTICIPERRKEVNRVLAARIVKQNNLMAA